MSSQRSYKRLHKKEIKKWMESEDKLFVYMDPLKVDTQNSFSLDKCHFEFVISRQKKGFKALTVKTFGQRMCDVTHTVGF